MIQYLLMRMGRSGCFIGVVVVVSLLLPRALLAYPERLDDAHVGPVSPANPFFGEVIGQPLQEGEWFKLAETLYQGPSGTVYEYNPYSGRMKELGNVTQVGDRIYGPDGTIISRTIHEYDAQGQRLRTRVYGDFAFSGTKLRAFSRTDYGAGGELTARHDVAYEDGHLASRRTTSYDDEGRATHTEKLQDISFGRDGRIAGYERVLLDGDGVMQARYVYSDFDWREEGAPLRYTRHRYDARNRLIDRNTIMANDRGGITARARVIYNARGELVASYADTRYERDEAGRLRGFHRIVRDADGDIVQEHVYRDFTFHGTGENASYQRLDYDPDGTLLRQHTFRLSPAGALLDHRGTVYENGRPAHGWRASGFAYDEVGRPRAYRLEYLNRRLEPIQVVERSRILYDHDNRLFAYSDRRMRPDGTLIEWIDVSGRRYTGADRLATYSWMRRNADGNVVESGSWLRPRRGGSER